MQQKKVTERDDNKIPNSDKPISGSIQAEVCMNRDVGLDNIVAHIKSLNGHGVTCGGMTGKKIRLSLNSKQLRSLGGQTTENTFTASNQIK